jgi:hypothetical protein
MLMPLSRIETACNDFCAYREARDVVLLAMGVWECLAVQPLRARWNTFQALRIVAQSKYRDRLHQGPTIPIKLTMHLNGILPNLQKLFLPKNKSGEQA